MYRRAECGLGDESCSWSCFDHLADAVILVIKRSSELPWRARSAQHLRPLLCSR